MHLKTNAQKTRRRWMINGLFCCVWGFAIFIVYEWYAKKIWREINKLKTSLKKKRPHIPVLNNRLNDALAFYCQIAWMNEL